MQRGEGSVDQDKRKSTQLVSAGLLSWPFVFRRLWEVEVRPWSLICMRPWGLASSL